MLRIPDNEFEAQHDEIGTTSFTNLSTRPQGKFIEKDSSALLALQSTSMDDTSLVLENRSNAKGIWGRMSQPLVSLLTKNRDNRRMALAQTGNAINQNSEKRGIVGTISLTARRRFFNLWDKSSPDWANAVPNDVVRSGLYSSRQQRLRLGTLGSKQIDRPLPGRVINWLVAKKRWLFRENSAPWSDDTCDENGDAGGYARFQLDPSPQLQVFGRAERRRSDRNAASVRANNREVKDSNFVFRGVVSARTAVGNVLTRIFRRKKKGSVIEFDYENEDDDTMSVDNTIPLLPLPRATISTAENLKNPSLLTPVTLQPELPAAVAIPPTYSYRSEDFPSFDTSSTSSSSYKSALTAKDSKDNNGIADNAMTWISNQVRSLLH